MAGIIRAFLVAVLLCASCTEGQKQQPMQQSTQTALKPALKTAANPARANVTPATGSMAGKPAYVPPPSVKQPTKQEPETGIYECVLCAKPAAGVMRAAATSAAAQQQAVTALQAAGLQVRHTCVDSDSRIAAAAPA